MKLITQIRSLFPSAPIYRETTPCAAERFIASRIKRQQTTPPFPRVSDPQPSIEEHFAADLFRVAAERIDHPPPAHP